MRADRQDTDERRRVDRPAVVLCCAALAICVVWIPLGGPMAGWLSAVVLSLMLAGLMLHRLAGLATPSHLLPLVGFAAAGLVSSIFSPYPDVSLSRSSAGVILLAAFPAAQLVGRSSPAIRVLAASMCVSTSICAVDILSQYAFGHSLLLGTPAPADGWRFSGSLANANEIGFVALFLPIVLAVLRTPRLPLLTHALSASVVLAALLTGSRATLGGLVVGGAVRSWFGRRRFLRWLGVLIAVVVAIAWIGDLGSFRRRAGETMRPLEEMRLRTWHIALDAFLERPILGHGPGVFFEINEASRADPDSRTPPGGMPWVHNLPLEILVERGVVGGALAIMIALQIVRSLRQALVRDATRAYGAALCASLLTFAAMSMLDLTLLKDWCSLALWTVSGLAIAAGEAGPSEWRGSAAAQERPSLPQDS